MSWAIGQDIADPDELETLPIGAEINDAGLKATKTESGAWLYAHDGEHWEPQIFPCVLIGLP